MHCYVNDIGLMHVVSMKKHLNISYGYKPLHYQAPVDGQPFTVIKYLMLHLVLS